MSKCKFAVDYQGSVEEMITKVSEKIKEKGGKLEGDANGGTMNIATPIGAITGNYAVNGQSIEFEITEKPMFLSCGMIEDELRKYLNKSGGAVA